LNTITLSIAGFKIKLLSEAGVKIGVEEGYLPFVISGHHEDADISIKTIEKKHLTGDYLSEKDLIFEAKDSHLKYYSIFREDQGYKFFIYNQEGPNTIQQLAYLDEGLTTWTVYAGPSGPGKEIFPLLYPLGPLVLYYLTVKFEAIMIHASGILDGKKGRLFTGFSGTGKSTMANLWLKSGSSVINDDRLIIRAAKTGFVIHNTPMFYADSPKVAPLHTINLIKHAQKNEVTRLNGANAVSGLMAYCIQHSYDQGYIEHHLDFLAGLCSQLPVYEVGFTPHLEIVGFIKTYAV